MFGGPLDLLMFKDAKKDLQKYIKLQVQTDAIKCSLCRAIFVRFNGVIPGCHCPLWSLKRKPTETAGKWIFINVVMVMVRPFDQSP